jgi:hypothetical protein
MSRKDEGKPEIDKIVGSELAPEAGNPGCLTARACATAGKPAAAGPRYPMWVNRLFMRKNINSFQ